MKTFPVLESDRLVLRDLAPEDAADVLALYSNPEVTRFSEMVTLTTLLQADQVIRRFRADFELDAGVRWAIARRESPRLIGTCGVVWHRQNHSALLSYDLAQEFWNQGHVTGALRLMVAYTFETMGMNRITATTTLENAASIRVLRKAGFQEEGILRDWAFWKGAFCDLRCFSLLRRDPLPR